MKISEAVRSEIGAALVLVAVCMVAIISVAALAIDVGMLVAERTHLQSTADASALAGAALLPDAADVTAEVLAYSAVNHSAAIVLPAEITLGNWDSTTGTFTPGGNPTNAVSVIVRRTAAEGNSVPTFFARMFGVDQVDVTVYATATGNPGPPGSGSRFIVDAEMIDSDIPIIEQLAASLGVDSEDLISDLDGDWFIDLPPGTILELPTGQVGDTGLFDIDHPEFPFGPSSSPSFEDFLNYNEDSNSWRYELIPKDKLDPLLGVSAVDDPNEYPSFVDPDYCQVSPVYKSDVNALNPTEDVPPIVNVNALGWRRGLLAFKVLAVGVDPDGSGSVLPNLVIQVCDPGLVDLAEVYPGPGAAGIDLKIVQ